MDTGLKRLLLSLLWRYVAEGGLEPPLTIIVSFDIGKQLSFRGYPRGKTGLVEECGFQHFKAAFDGRNFDFWISYLNELAVLCRGVLAAADQNGGSGHYVAFVFGWPSSRRRLRVRRAYDHAFAQPISFLVQRPRTTTKKSQPPSVGTSVISSKFRCEMEIDNRPPSCAFPPGHSMCSPDPIMINSHGDRFCFKAEDQSNFMPDLHAPLGSVGSA